MNYKEFFKGDYIAAAEMELGKPTTLTIKEVRKVRLESMGPVDGEGGGEKKERDRGVVYFRETDRGWVLNRTNAECLVAMWGMETNAWLGKRVTLYATPVRVGKKTEPGIRVKGSPDLTAPMMATVQLPRRRPQQIELVPTGRPAAPAQQQQQPPQQ